MKIGPLALRVRFSRDSAHKWVVGSTFEWEFDLPMPTMSITPQK